MNNYSELIIKKAIKFDVEAIYRIIQKRCEWLDSKNINQWNCTRTYNKDYYLKKIEEGKFYIAELNENIVGTFMVQFNSQYYKDNKDVMHIHHLATDLQYKGIGKEIIKKIKQIAIDNNKKYVRLDNIGTNERLNRYYEEIGFHQIEIIKKEDYDGINYGILRELKIKE